MDRSEAASIDDETMDLSSDGGPGDGPGRGRSWWRRSQKGTRCSSAAALLSTAAATGMVVAIGLSLDAGITTRVDGALPPVGMSWSPHVIDIVHADRDADIMTLYLGRSADGGLLGSGEGLDRIIAKLDAEAVAARLASTSLSRAEPVVDLSSFNDAELQPKVIKAVQKAGQLTGADPAFLMAVAWKESRFDVKADNSSSSARGLFQFTSTTWMRAVKAFGERHGLGHLASAIRELQDGRMAVNGGLRTKLLRLRDDPKWSALMAAEFSQKDRERLKNAIGRDAKPVDLYMAHLLGISSAVRFIRAVEKRPSASSHAVVPRAATANPGVFGRTNNPRTVVQVYRRIETSIGALQKRYGELLKVAKDLPQRGAASTAAPPTAKPADGRNWSPPVPRPKPPVVRAAHTPDHPQDDVNLAMVP